MQGGVGNKRKFSVYIGGGCVGLVIGNDVYKGKGFGGVLVDNDTVDAEGLGRRKKWKENTNKQIYKLPHRIHAANLNKSDKLNLQRLKLCSKVTEKLRLFNDFISFNIIAVGNNFVKNFSYIINVTLGINPAGYGHANEFHL